MGYEERGEQVLKAAAKVFAARGFHQASVREVASEAGMSLAGLYYYFPSKADLLYRIGANAFDVLLARLDDALGHVNGPYERLRVFIQNHLDFFLSHMDEMKVVSREADFLTGEFHAVVAEKQRQYYLRCIEILKDLNGARRSGDDLRASTLALFGMINWIFAWYRPDKDGDAKHLADRMAELFLYGFLRREETVGREGSPPGDAASAFTLAWDASERPLSGHVSRGQAHPNDTSGGMGMNTASFEELIEKSREIVTTPVGEVASAWKRSHPGGKVVGCFPVYTPVELIHASGALPLGVIGGGNQIEIAHADSRFQSFVCSIVKSTLELGLTDKLGDVDAMFFQSICDPARNLASIFKRNFPAMMIEYLHQDRKSTRLNSSHT